MIKYVASIVACLLSTGVAAQTDSSRYIQHLYSTVRPLEVDARYMSDIFQHTSLSQYIDNHIDDAHVHFETTADYDVANPYLISFTGASYKWTKFSYDGIRINNPLMPGDALHHLPISRMHTTIDPIAGSIDLSPSQQSASLLQLSSTAGNLGGRVGFTDWFINNISGHRSAQERYIFDIQQRPYTQWQTEGLLYTTMGENLPLTIHATTGQRVHVDQQYDGANTSYSEPYTRFAAYGTASTADLGLGQGLHYILSGATADAHGAEYQYQQAETSSQALVNATLYTKKQLDGGGQQLGLSFAHRSLSKLVANFDKNILDQDGEGLEPYHQDGTQRAVSLYFQRTDTVNSHWHYTLEANNSLHHHRPDQEQFSTTIYRQSTAADYLPLHRIDWQAGAFTSGLLENAAKLTYTKASAKQQLRLTGGLHAYGMLVSGDSRLSVAPSLDLGWQVQAGKHWTISTRAGFHPNRHDVDQIRFLSDDHLRGTARLWTDTNGDQRATDDELGNVLYQTGGATMQTADNLGVSTSYYIDVPFTYQPSKRWQWQLVGQFRQYRNTWGVEHIRPHEELGDFERIGHRQIWYSTEPITSYSVEPLSTDRMNSRGGESESVLFDQPYYGGVTFRFEHNSNRWFFSGSMTANMIVGYAGMGNGPLHNNVNAPSITMADPSLRQNQVGRLDNDRSFISRIVVNYKYSDRGAAGIQLKYKDGQSFAIYEHYIRSTAEGNQIAFHQSEVRGDNPINGDRGRREDFFTNFELYAQHRFPLSRGGFVTVRATMHNLLDFSNETSEYIFGNVEGFSRAPLELHVPRTFTFTVGYGWQ